MQQKFSHSSLPVKEALSQDLHSEIKINNKQIQVPKTWNPSVVYSRDL